MVEVYCSHSVCRPLSLPWHTWELGGLRLDHSLQLGSLATRGSQGSVHSSVVTGEERAVCADYQDAKTDPKHHLGQRH